MIVKILKTVPGFPGIRYNTNKVDHNKGELMRVSGFGSLQGLQDLRPQDYINYLQLVSSTNTRIEKPQFHTVISCKGRMYTKEELTEIGRLWMEQMGYGGQPYLTVFHKDTANNHIHLVSTRIGKDGKKINSAYERFRAVSSMDRVLGYELALQYNLSTKAQFYLILESRGHLGRDYSEAKLAAHLASYKPDKDRMMQLRSLLIAYKDESAYTQMLMDRYQVQLVFHAAEGKAPYGYTILDHDTRQVFKGSEVLSLKYLSSTMNDQATAPNLYGYTEKEAFAPATYIGPVWIADDVDDEAIMGVKRRRKRKSTTNTR